MNSDAALAWIVGNDTGASSKALWAKMMGQNGDRSHPHDASDLGRCLRLLTLIPEWNGRLGEMKAVSPYWAALVDRWTDLTASYSKDQADGTHKTYDLMESILRPVEKDDEKVVRLSDTVSFRFGS